MGCLTVQSFIEILVDTVKKKPTPLSSILIPNRGSKYLQTLLHKLDGLQNRAGRHKRLIAVSEISIPNRDYQLPVGYEALTLMFLFYYIWFDYCKEKNWDCLPLLILYDLEKRRLQRLKTGTEIRWTAFWLSDVLVFSFLAKKPLVKQYGGTTAWKATSSWNFSTCVPTHLRC